MDSLVAGVLVARRYRLIDQIGAGGMSVIWRARDEVLDRVVALKVLAPALSADPQLRRLVREEARAAARLDHPHVTAVHDYGEAFAPDGTPIAFVVHELLAGESLSARLTAGPLPWPEAVEVAAQVAGALATAHRLGIVHRDVTPDNIMLTPVGAKVLDFGIATRIGAPDEDEDGATFGTPTYVAPERLDGVPAQPAADVYALGVLLYEALSGQPPYRAHTWEDLAGVPREIPPLPGAEQLPPQVNEICRRCLARSPADRPTAAQVARALRDVVPPSRSSRGRAVRAAAAAGAVVALVAAVAAAVLLSRDGGERPVGAPPPTSAPVTTPVPTTPAVASPAPRITSPAPLTPGRTLTVDESLAALTQVIDARVAAGEIRSDAAQDLRQEIGNLRQNLASGQIDMGSWVDGLRVKVADRQREGALTPAAASALTAALDNLERATAAG